jgi:hypothetical protein
MCPTTLQNSIFGAWSGEGQLSRSLKRAPLVFPAPLDSEVTGGAQLVGGRFAGLSSPSCIPNHGDAGRPLLKCADRVLAHNTLGTSGC